MIGELHGYTNLGVLNVLTRLTAVLDSPNPSEALVSLEFETTGIGGAKATLSQEEQAYIGELLGAIVARITMYHTATMMGFNVAHRVTLDPADPWYLSAQDAANIEASSLIDARANTESQVRNYLMNSESRQMTHEQFRTAMSLK